MSPSFTISTYCNAIRASTFLFFSRSKISQERPYHNPPIIIITILYDPILSLGRPKGGSSLPMKGPIEIFGSYIFLAFVLAYIYFLVQIVLGGKRESKSFGVKNVHISYIVIAIQKWEQIHYTRETVNHHQTPW